MRTSRTVGLLVLCIAHLAWAQPVSDGEKAFERGREMLQIGKYTEACAAFRESQRLAPQTITQFNIALCSEQLGKLATALAIHQELAKTEATPQRRAKSADYARDLGRRVPRLRIDVADPKKAVPAGLVVTVGDVQATNFRDMPIDLGPSKVVANAPGFQPWMGTVTASAEGKLVTIAIALRPGAADAVPVVAEPADETPSPPLPVAELVTPPPPRRTSGSGRKALGAITTVTGAIALGGGVAAGVLARGKWNAAKAACGGSTSCATEAELARGDALADAARLRGNISTALVIAGGALVVGGVVLWVTSPSAERAVALAPTTDGSSAGLAVLGRF